MTALLESDNLHRLEQLLSVHEGQERVKRRELARDVRTQCAKTVHTLLGG